MDFNNRTVEINGKDYKVEFKKDLATGIFRVYCITNLKTGKKYYGLTMLDLTPLKGMPFVNQRTVFELVKATFGDTSAYKEDVSNYGDKKWKVEEVCAVIGIEAGMQAEKDAIATAKANGEDLYNSSNGGEYRKTLTKECIESLATCIYDNHNKSIDEIAEKLRINARILKGLSSNPGDYGITEYTDDKGKFITVVDKGKVRKLYLPLRAKGKQEIIDRLLKFKAALSPKAYARLCEKNYIDFSSVFTALIKTGNGDFIITERVTKERGIKIRKAIKSNKYTDNQLCIKFNITPKQLFDIKSKM